MVLNELIELTTVLIKQTKTIKGALIVGIILLLLSGTVIAGGITAVLFVERRFLINMIADTPTLDKRIDSGDYDLIKNYYSSQVEHIRSVNLVVYEQGVREATVVHSYPSGVENFPNLTRPYRTDADVHAQHFQLQCTTRPHVPSDFLRSSCPIFHSTRYGVEGYVFAMYHDKTADTDTIIEIERSLHELVESIGVP